MTHPIVSIIVPVYNVGEQLLRPCIESALAQTFRKFELILVDDASTDNSAAICAEYAAADPRVRLLRLPQNGGLANARNKGVEMSTGRFVTFLDADDRLISTAVMQFYKATLEGSADIIVADIGKPKSKKAREYTATEAVEDMLYQRTINNSACGKLFPRELCVKQPFLGGWYEDLRTIPRVFLQAYKVAYLPERLYLYTDNPASYLHTFNVGRAVVLDVTEELVEYMAANYPCLVKAAHDRALSAAFNIFNLLTANKVSAPEIEERCKRIIRQYRRESLLNPQVRLKNKLAIILSYIGGFPVLKLAAKLFQKK